MVIINNYFNKMTDTAFYILPVEREEFIAIVSQALSVYKQKEDIYEKARDEVLGERPEGFISDLERDLSDSERINGIVQENPDYNRLVEEYESLVGNFDNIIQKSYQEITGWLIGEITARRDKVSDYAYIEINRGKAYFKNQLVDMEYVNKKPDSFEFKLDFALGGHYWGHVNKKTVNPKTVEELSEILPRKIIHDFGQSAILFLYGTAEKGYNAFKDAVLARFGERVVSAEDMKEMYRQVCSPEPLIPSAA